MYTPKHIYLFIYGLLIRGLHNPFLANVDQPVATSIFININAIYIHTCGTKMTWHQVIKVQ